MVTSPVSDNMGVRPASKNGSLGKGVALAPVFAFALGQFPRDSQAQDDELVDLPSQVLDLCLELRVWKTLLLVLFRMVALVLSQG
jgi:hypothetical protein